MRLILGGLIFHGWKYQLAFNLLTYIVLCFVVKHLGIEFLIGGSAFYFLEDLIVHHIIPFLLSAYIEKVI